MTTGRRGRREASRSRSHSCYCPPQGRARPVPGAFFVQKDSIRIDGMTHTAYEAEAFFLDENGLLGGCWTYIVLW